MSDAEAIAAVAASSSVLSIALLVVIILVSCTEGYTRWGMLFAGLNVLFSLAILSFSWTFGAIAVYGYLIGAAGLFLSIVLMASFGSSSQPLLVVLTCFTAILAALSGACGIVYLVVAAFYSKANSPNYYDQVRNSGLIICFICEFLLAAFLFMPIPFAFNQQKVTQGAVLGQGYVNGGVVMVPANNGVMMAPANNGVMMTSLADPASNSGAVLGPGSNGGVVLGPGSNAGTVIGPGLSNEDKV